MTRWLALTAAIALSACSMAPPTAGETSTTAGQATTTVADATTTTAGTTEPTVPTDLSPTEVGPPAGTALSPLGEEVSILGSPDLGAPELATVGFDETVEATGFMWIGDDPDASWYEVRLGGSSGFVQVERLAVLGGTDDITAAVVDYIGGYPSAPTMEELAAEVVAARGGGPWHVSQPASEGDLGEVTVDLIGFADDAIMGERLHVFAEEADGGWSLRSVERTLLCRRGADTDGACA